MRFFKKKNTPCPDEDFCSTCGSCYKEKRCEGCQFYKLIDSALGWCIFNPKPYATAWCRDICGQFKAEKE